MVQTITIPFIVLALWLLKRLSEKLANRAAEADEQEQKRLHGALTE